VLVVGAGRAGLAAAEELRHLGYSGTVTVVGEEPTPTYDRTACSKGLLTGLQLPSDVLLPIRVHPGDIEWQRGVRAVDIDLGSRAVLTDTGTTYHYDGLVIATGTRPVLPTGWRYGAPGLYTVHGLADVEPLARDLRQSDRVVVIGAGLTGCEVAYAVRSLRRDCVLVDSRQQVLTQAIGARAGWLVTQELLRDGISMRLGRRVSGIATGRHSWHVQLDDGETIDTDLVVATLGERPDTSWLAGSGLDITDGVLCDPTLRVVGAEGVVAAGSVARWPNQRFDNRPVRYGNWIAALEQGRAAARSLLDPEAPAFGLVPRIWSELGDLRIQVFGERPDDADEEVTLVRPGRVDAARAGVLVSYTVRGRPVGLLAINASSAFVGAMRELVAVPARVPAIQDF
jgi:NAD(P)H-nitrite reductase large subunit